MGLCVWLPTAGLCSTKRMLPNGPQLQGTLHSGSNDEIPPLRQELCDQIFHTAFAEGKALHQ